MKLDNFEKSLKLSHKGNISKLFNIRFISFESETATFEVLFPDICLNPHGTAQGGMVTCVLDETTGITASAYAEGKYLFNTTDIHVSFHRPTFEGKALIRTNILKSGRTITSIQGQLFSHEDKLAATVLHTGMIVKKQEE